MALIVVAGRATGGPAAWGLLLPAFGIPLSLALGNVYRGRAWPTGSGALPLVTDMLTLQGLVTLAAE